MHISRCFIQQCHISRHIASWEFMTYEDAFLQTVDPFALMVSVKAWIKCPIFWRHLSSILSIRCGLNEVQLGFYISGQNNINYKSAMVALVANMWADEVQQEFFWLTVKITLITNWLCKHSCREDSLFEPMMQSTLHRNMSIIRRIKLNFIKIVIFMILLPHIITTFGFVYACLEFRAENYKDLHHICQIMFSGHL